MLRLVHLVKKKSQMVDSQLGLRESGHYWPTYKKVQQEIGETQQDAESGLMVECFL